MFPFELVSPELVYKLVMAPLIFILILTLISLFGRYPYLELATHFRLQYALASFAYTILLTVFHSWKLLPLALALSVFNLFYILPYYFATPRPDGQPQTINLRLLQANVLWSNRSYAAFAEAVHQANADVIVLQEFTEKWLEQTRALASDYPYYKTVPRPGGAGMALFSRYPLEEVAILNLDASAHLALLAKVNVDGAILSILSLHPPTPVRTDKFLNRNRQFSAAASILGNLNGPRLLIGDLNTTMWSPYFIDLVRESGLRDARIGFGLNPSWPVPLPVFLQLPIDHCLVSVELSVEEIRTGGRTGSDHRALIVDIRM
jgi:endonuclease/exonuclease/phosphatase (EEP) superfamily protein YafD